MPHAEISPGPIACLNCGHAWGSPRPSFCPACGQETNVRAPRLVEFVQQFGGAYFATEGALWRTLKLLLFKPGALTREYLAGRRRHYVLPLRLYLSVSLVVLLLVRMSSAVQFDVSAAKVQEVPKTFVVLEFGAGLRAGIAGGKFYCEGLPAWACERLERRLDLDPKNVAREMRELPARFFSHWGTAMFALVPAFAGWQMLAYRNRRLRYTEHLVFALHLHTLWFALLPLLAVDFTPIQAAAVIWVPWYSLLAARSVYGGRWWTTLLRAATVTSLYGVTLLLALGVVAVWALLG
jgi:hypothetical protein